jgi:hypothetical protein
MKCVFKSGALATIYGNNQFGDQYRYLICEKKYCAMKRKECDSKTNCNSGIWDYEKW